MDGIYDPFREPEQVLADLGLRTCGTRKAHPRDQMWLTRKMIVCGACRLRFGRHSFPELEAEVKAIRPRVHCREWRIGDPEDAFHGAGCLAQARRRRFVVMPGGKSYAGGKSK